MTITGARLSTPIFERSQTMFRRSFTHALDRAAEMLVRERRQPRITGVGERMEWMRGGAILANVRVLPMTAELAAAGMPFGYWRGLHPRMRTEFELALLTRGQQLRAATPRYEVTVTGMRHARTLQRTVRRLITLGSAADERVIEIVHVETSRRCGLTWVRAAAQPLRLQPALQDFMEREERSA
jgi:hypothetical protein